MSGNQESNIGQQPAQTANQGSGTKKRKPYPTQVRGRELVDYDPDTGIVTRKIKRKGSNGVGSVIGCVGKRGYIYVQIDGGKYRLHRIIWLWYYGYVVEHGIDHINRCKTDNRIVNLREESQKCNLRNTGIRSDNKTGVKGVRWDKRDGAWVSAIRAITGKDCSLYWGRDFTEAVSYRLAAEQALAWPGHDIDSTAYLYMQNYLQESKCQKA